MTYAPSLSHLQAAEDGDRAAFKYVLDIIHAETLTTAQQGQIVKDTLSCWQQNVNSGFLKYRKSVANDFAAIEWRDGEPGGATMLVSVDVLTSTGVLNRRACRMRRATPSSIAWAASVSTTLDTPTPVSWLLLRPSLQSRL